MKPEDLARLPKGLRKHVQWMNDPASFERTRLDVFDIGGALQSFLLSEDMPDEVYDTLSAICLALHNWHPHFRLKWSPTSSGKQTVIKRFKGDPRMPELANFIDVEVANGRKTESAIEAACSKFSVSRPTAFRMLQFERGIRRSCLELGEPYNAPDGYEVTESGLLKPSNG